MALVFGKYEKIKRIAQGGMGEVFLARQTGVLDRLAILKSLRHDLALEREFVDQFLDEARVAATLNHPNIVSIYDVGEWNGTYYIAMEYVPGEDLSKLWYAAAKAGVGLPFQVSVRICFEAAQGLDHAHKAKDVRGLPLSIVHRDVSPQNIMVRGDGVVKLVDFGIAKAANKSSRTQAGMVKGKLQYMSPEQVRGEALDGRSDQFSLGVVLWEMCTGRRLFKADSEINTLQKILNNPIPKPSEHVPGFPLELEAAIMRMLQREADRRYKHLGDVAIDLKAYLDRSALAGPETTVTSFVQQILGKELDDRIADLTPMETTEPGSKVATKPLLGDVAPAPLPGDPTAANERPGQDIPTAEERGRKDRPAAPARPSSPDVLAQSAPTPALIVPAPRPLPPSADAALTASRNAEPVLPAAARASGAQAPAAHGAQALGAQSQPPTLGPLGAGAKRERELSLDLSVPQPTDGKTGAFQLGDLPPAMTGTWGAPAIARPGGANRGGHVEVVTPAIREADALPRAAGVPTLVWMLGGVVVLFAIVVGGLAAVSPDTLRSLVGGSRDTEIVKAVTAARDDDPPAIDALLGDALAGVEQDESPERLAAAALLHLSRARIDEDALGLAGVLRALGDANAPPVGDLAAEAEAHRVASYSLATRALALDARAAGAALAKAAYQGERGATAELATDAEQALALAKGTPLEQLVTQEIEIARALAAGRQALTAADAEGLRAAARTLSAFADKRAKSGARVLHAKAASLAEDPAPDFERLRDDLRALPPGGTADPRVAQLTALVKHLDGVVHAPGKPKPRVPPAEVKPAPPPPPPPDVAAAPSRPEPPTQAPPPAASASAPPETPARPVETPSDDATTDKPAATSDGADTASADAASADAGAPEETFDSALDKAKKSAKAFKHKETARWARKAVELRNAADPPAPNRQVIEAQLLLARAFLAMDVPESARATFQQVLGRDDDNCEAHFGIAVALEAQQKTEEARQQYLKYAEVCPDGKDIESATSAAARLE